MHTSNASQKARSRSRQRRQAANDADLVVEAPTRVVVSAGVAQVVPFRAELDEHAPPPFDPPEDHDEIFGVGAEFDGEDTFIAITAEGIRLEPPPEFDDDVFVAVNESEEELSFETTVVNPDWVESEPEAVAAPQPLELTQPTAAVEEEDAPFDPPDEVDDGSIKKIFVEDLPPIQLAPAEPLLLTPPAAEAPAPKAALGVPREERPHTDHPVPPIKIHCSWDRPEMLGLLSLLEADRRLSRAEITVARGGVEGAALHFARNSSPDLLVVDTTLRGKHMTDALDRLRAVLDPATKIVVLGAVNDITLLRELATRGVSEYIVGAVKRDDLVRTVCALYADVDHSRVIAVMGVCGGVGASSIAQNIAWSIAERQQVDTALVDFDLSFGTAAFSFHQSAELTVDDLLGQPEEVDAAFERVALKPRPQLQVIAAPSVMSEHEPDLEAVLSVIQGARRATPYVVLDLPHLWSGMVKVALAAADEIVLVAGPDLASLRNIDNVLKHLKTVRTDKAEPIVVLSMVGVPKRPEIPLRDFSDATGSAPVFSFPFDPALFGAAAVAGQSLYEASPRAKSAMMIDALATLLTGREPVARKRAERRAETTKPEPPAPAVTAEATAPQSAAPVVEEVAFAEAPLAPATEPTPEVVTLDLTDRAAPEVDPYISVALQAARAEYFAVTQKRHTSPALRVAAVVVAGLVATTWLTQDRRATLEPAMAAAATPAPAVTPPLSPVAEYGMALALTQQNNTLGLERMRGLAEDGSALAQQFLAGAYERGDGVATDLALAREWTLRAAAGGNVRAMHNLGVYYARGEGAAVDDASAFRWFRQAAEFGLADSQYNLGVLYEQGRGVTQSGAEALFWYALAAQQGDEAAAARVIALEGVLTPMQVEQARGRATAFRPSLPNPNANVPEVQEEPEAPPPEAAPPSGSEP